MRRMRTRTQRISSYQELSNQKADSSPQNPRLRNDMPFSCVQENSFGSLVDDWEFGEVGVSFIGDAQNDKRAIVVGGSALATVIIGFSEDALSDGMGGVLWRN